MKVHPLLARIESIVEAPGNIQNLRKLAIVLAVSGRLGVQKRNKVASANNLLKVGKHAKQATDSPIYESELPSGLTSTDGFVRLAEIANIERGPTAIQRAKPGDYPLVTTAEERSSCDHFDFDTSAAIIPLVSSAGHGKATLKRLQYQEGKFALGNILCSAIPISEQVITARFIFEYLTAFKEELLVSKMTGTANVTLTVGKIRGIPIPIVSPEVQQSLDSFMVLCDRLEVAQRERECRRDHLTASTHHHLNNGTDADVLRSHAQFFIRHFPCLVARPDQIRQLRQTILNLAIRGKLVEQRQAEASSSSLLIENDRARKAVAKHDRRADAPRQELLVPHLRWVTSPSWQWSALADAVLFIDYRGKTPNKIEGGVRLITAKNVKKGFIDRFPEEFLSESEYRTWMTRGLPINGDILFTTEAPMGNAAVVRLKERFALAQRVICFRPYGAIDPDFLIIQILSDPFQTILDELATGLTAKGIKAAKLKRVPLAIPPLAEQHRIVDKVGKLMALCDQLEARLATAETEAARLVESVLHHALQTPHLD